MADSPATITTSNYGTTLPGILKIVEAVLCLTAFICSMIPYYWTPGGGGWVQFVTITALIGVLLVLFLNIFMYGRLPDFFPLLVFIFYVVYDVFFFISAILAAVRAGQYYRYNYNYFWGNRAAIAACAFFCFAALIVFVIDTWMSFNNWRLSNTGGTSGHTTSTTTTTTKSSHTVTVG